MSKEEYETAKYLTITGDMLSIRHQRRDVSSPMTGDRDF